MKQLSLYTLLLVLLVPVAAPGAARPRVYAKVDAETTIYPGDEFVYSIVVEGGAKPSRINLSALMPLKPRRVGSGTEMQMVNGQTAVTYSENYAIIAGQAGTMQLPAVTVVVDGQTYTTDPVEVTVSPPGTTDQLALELLVSDRQCYVGQPLVMTIKWTITTGINGYRFDVPVFTSDDFYIEDVSESAAGLAQEQAMIGDVLVTMTEDRRLIRGMAAAIISFSKVLIPKRSGPIKLAPVTVTTNVAVGRERTNDFFNPYRIKYERVSVQSNPVELNVLPLPETGRPPQFYGLVGRYTISALASPVKVNVGDPITLTIRVGGSPYLTPVQWPALEQVPELAANFRIPAERASPVVEGGYKVFTQTIRANNDAVTAIPPIPLAYFDSQRGEYVTVRTEPIKLDVAPSKVLTTADVEGTAAGPVNREVEAVRKGLSANYYGPELLVNQSFSLLSAALSPAYAALWSIPLAVLLVSTVARLASRTSPESVARKRQSQAATAAMRRLDEALDANARGRHPLLLLALKQYIGDRFDRVAASLTADDCYHAIVESTGDTERAARFRELIAACEAARYAPLDAQIGRPQVQEAALLIRVIEKQCRRRDVNGDYRKPGSRNRPGTAGTSFILGFSFVVLLSALWVQLLSDSSVFAGTADTEANTPSGDAPSSRPGSGGPLRSRAARRGTTQDTVALPREELHALLDEANTAFRLANGLVNNPDRARQLYEQAILLYEKVIDQGGVRNARLYYNLANAYLLKEDVGRAILNYRRAARLDGSDINLRKNLAFARSRRIDKVEVGAERRVLETLFFWHYDFSLRTRFLLACLSFAGLCLALTVVIWRGSGPVASAFALFCGVLVLCFLTSILAESHRQANTHYGVITVAEVVARQGDGPNYPASFKDPLHAGTEFELLEQRPGWLHIQLSNGTDTWIPDDTAGIV